MLPVEAWTLNLLVLTVRSLPTPTLPAISVSPLAAATWNTWPPPLETLMLPSVEMPLATLRAPPTLVFPTTVA